MASPQVLCAVFGATVLKGHKTITVSKKRATKMVKGLEGKAYKKQLKSLDLLSPEKRRLREDYIMAYSFFRRVSRGAGIDLLSLVTTDRTEKKPEVVTVEVQVGYQEKVLQMCGGVWEQFPMQVVRTLSLLKF